MDELKKLSRAQKRKIALGSGITGALMLGYAINDMYGISSDVGYIRKLLALKKAVEHHNANNNTYADIWEDAVKKWPRKACLHFEGKDFTFEQVDKTANRIAHWAVGRGVKAGDVVALMMENRAEYLPIWLGLLKAGSIVALINCNLKGRPLLHSLTISKAKLLIVGTELLESVDEQRAQLLREGWSIVTQGGSGSQGLDAEIANLSTATPSRKLRNGVKFSDPALLVYTSGTTGLPKAATLKHLRLFTMGAAFVSMFNVQHDDRIYCVLPLYHSAGGVCGVGMMVLAGGTLVLKRKFSATQFWADCREQKVTVVQYIGELCRYLLAAPPSKHDQAHKVRIAIGNGLRPDIWESFQKRFNVPEIGEFYGSTEGNAALFNHCTDAASRGAVGRMGPLLYKASQMKLVKFDVQREEPVRDKNGMLIECKRGEVGELLGEIVDGDPVRGFAGYYGNAGATKNKIVSDCFKKGDKYFRTGDLLKHDEKGYWHFIDRIGDTFRWKGENVSTTEVAEAVSIFPGVSEVNVYGVEVPKGDGRACMAAMIFDDKIDMKALAQHVLKNLPPYAIPLFLRKLPRIEVTGTFKHQKVELRDQGINPDKCVSEGNRDALWRYDESSKTYKPFGSKEFVEFQAPRAKL